MAGLNFQKIVQQYGTSNHIGLSGLEAIDTRINIDGVGTKTIIARKMDKYNTIGIDLVSACCNDITVMGAKPLTFLDYIANDKLKPQIIKKIIYGIAQSCKENKIALVGGETAEMPNTYLKGEHDIVGVVSGVVEKIRQPPFSCIYMPLDQECIRIEHIFKKSHETPMRLGVKNS